MATLAELATPKSKTLEQLAQPEVKSKSLAELAMTKSVNPVQNQPNEKPFLERMAEAGRGGIYKALGIAAWPFERVGNLIATPITSALEARLDTLKNRQSYEQPSFNVPAERPASIPQQQRAIDMPVSGAQRIKEVKAFGKGLLSAGKALNPFGDVPEEVRTHEDFWGTYYETMTGEKSPKAYSQTAGMISSFAVDPLIVGKGLKAIGAGAKLTGIPQKLEAAKVPEWQVAKLEAKANLGERLEKAKTLGKSIAEKDLRDIATQLSEASGKPISTKAVQQRLGQIIKGSITTQPELAARANPVIEEFKANAKILRQQGILGEETYTTKLSNARVAELNTEKEALKQQVKKLETAVPYKNTLLNKVAELTPDINRQKILADKLVNVAIKAEERGQKVAGIGDQFIDAAIEVTTGSPLAKKVATLMDFAPGDKRLTLLGNKILSLSKMELTQRNQAAKEILDVAEKINPKVSSYASKTVNDVLKVATQIEDSKIIGQWPLLKYVESMKYNFPGKAGRLQELSNKIEQIDDKLFKSTHVGGEEYLPRMYLLKEEELAQAKKFGFYSKNRIRAPYAKAREDIPLEVRQQMGEIKEPAYPVTKRLIQQSHDIETSKLFEQAARNPEWTSDNWLPGFAEKALPDTKSLGALRGKFVLPRIYDDITEMTKVKNKFEQVYDTAIGAWKAGKVILNPASHFRNKMSNKILLDLSGMGYDDQIKYALKAYKEYRAGSPEYLAAKRYFATNTFVKGEILDDLLKANIQSKGDTFFEKVLNTTKNGIATAIKYPAELYQHEEFTNKFMKYLQQRDAGKSVIESVQEANKWLFDYSDLAGWEKTYARRVMPFYTFPRKAIPRIIEAAANNPYGLVKYPLAAKLMTQYSLAKLKMTDKDYEQMQDVLPEYMKSGSFILMPYRDNNNDLRFFDWTYMLPWGDIYNLQEQGLLKMVNTNPLVQITGDIQRNKSSFADREIWKDTDTDGEKFVKGLKYTWQALMPPLAYKGIYWDKLSDAVSGKPNKQGKKPSLPETALQTIGGIKTVPIDVKQQKIYRLMDKQGQVQELGKKIADIAVRYKNGNITKNEYEQRRSQYQQQIKDVLKK